MPSLFACVVLLAALPSGIRAHQNEAARTSAISPASTAAPAGSIAAVAPGPLAEAASPTPSAGNEAQAITVGYDASFAPMSRTDRNGEASGFAVEVCRRAALAGGLQPRFVAFASYSEAAQALRQRRIDVVLTAVDTAQRREFARFVGPYYTAPTVLVTSVDGGWPSLSSLAGKRLAIDQEHYLIPVLKKDAPEVIVVEFASVEAVMDAVSKGVVEAGVTNLEVAANYINDRYLGRLQISGTLAQRPSELSFMVRKDEPGLAASLGRGLAAIPPLEKTALANTLLRTRIEIGVPWGRVLWVVIPILALLSGLLLASGAYGRRLSKARAFALTERDAALQAAKARTEFLAEMGHEIRAPLAAIAGGLRLLHGEDMSPRTHALLTPILKSTERLVGLLNRLLDLARLEAGKIDLQLQSIDLAALVEDVAEQFRALADEKGLRIELKIQPGLPAFDMDPFRVQQVLNNLVSNAVKFSDHGRITVSLTGVHEQGAIWSLRLLVSDQGAGMSEEVQAHLFEKYAQFGKGTNARNGTGLGLPISREIVRQSGGQIVARSRPGEGSTFEVSLKVKASDTPALPELRQPGANVRVLMVDDDPVIPLLCSEFLRQRGCEVRCVASFLEAVEAMKETAFDILVTDQSLQSAGDENGLDLVAAAGRSDVQKPRKIYVLSGESRPSHALPANLDGWIEKPRSASDRSWLLQLGALVGRPA